MPDSSAHLIYVIPAVLFLSLVIVGVGLLMAPDSVISIWHGIINNGGLQY